MIRRRIAVLTALMVLAQAASKSGEPVAQAAPQHGDSGPVFFQRLAELQDAAAGVSLGTANADVALGWAQFRQGHFQAALVRFQSAVDRYTLAYGNAHPSTLEALNNLGYTYHSLKNDAHAASAFRKVLSAPRGATPRPDPVAANASHGLGLIYEAAGNTALAEIAYTQVLTAEQGASGDSAELIRVSVHLKLAALYEGAHEYARATEEHQAVLKYARTAQPAPGTRQMELNALASISIAAYHAENYRLAATFFEQTASAYAQEYGPDHDNTLSVLRVLSSVYTRLGDLAQATSVTSHVAELTEHRFGADTAETARASLNLGDAYELQGDHVQAIQAYLKAVQTRVRVLGEDHPDTVFARNSLGAAYVRAGKDQEAVQVLLQASTSLERAAGPPSALAASVYGNLGHAYKNAHQFAPSVAAAQKALEIRRVVNGLEDVQTADAENALGGAYVAAHQPEQALALHQHALAVFTRVYGLHHADTARTYDFLGEAYSALKNTAAEIVAFQQAASLMEAALGPEADETALAYNNLAASYYNDTGEYSKALDAYMKVLHAYGATSGPDSLKSAGAYANIGPVYGKLGDYARGLEYNLRALRIREKLLGPSALDTAASYGDLAVAYTHLGDYAHALDYAQRAVSVREQLLGPDHPDVAVANNNLAIVLKGMGDLPQALARHQRALQVFEKVYGENDAFTATAYSNLGSDYTDLGDLQKALGYYQQALAISLRVLGPDHPEVVTDYANLGTVYANLGDPARALEYHTRAYQHALALHGPDHPDVASALGLLGSDARDAGDDHKALTYYSRALEVRERTLGADHPETALTRNNLGFTYLQLGETQKALSALQQALSADTRVLGPAHPRTGTVLSNIAAVHARLGQYDLALPELGRSLDIALQNQQAAFTVLDDPGKVKYNATIRSDFWGSFHTQTDYAHTDPVRAQAYVAPALNAWLSFKGSAFALENGLALLTAHADAPLKASLETYLENRREFAQRATAVPTSVADARVNAARLDALQAQIAGLEAQLSARVGSFRLLLALNRIRLEELAAHLEKNEVYIDYAWFNSQLFAFTLDHAAHVHLFALGRSDDLQARVEALRVGAESGRPLKELRPNVTGLYDRLLRPLQGALKGASTLVISPDGPLNFLPFELLSDGKQTLLEHYTVRYTPSGRDLLRLRSTTGTRPGPSAVFGNPSFTGSLPVAPSGTPSVPAALPDGASTGLALSSGPASPGPRVRSLSSLLRGTVFSTLPGTQAETRSVAGLLGANTQTFLAAAANETSLFNLRSPRVLHLATHGFLLRDTPLPNPLLRVGIALSGAQTAVNSGGAYGLLSGLQLASLHLEGTQLVVLSACETGLGDAIAGEGVSGLNQAFLTAGARQVLLSLWKVPDVQTGELMTEFYRRYTSGTEAASALRAAQLTLMRRGLPPRDWAAFLLNGG